MDTAGTEPVPPLEGIHVLELSQLIAGPSAAVLLADYGAEVVKVEPPGGDAGRELRSVAATDVTDAPTFLAYNRNKRLVRLDLRSAEGREAALRLAAAADVVIESSRPGVMERLGLGPADVAAVNERAVYASVSGFGWDGPDGGRRGVDLVIQAESGIMSLTGEADGSPMKVGFTVVDAAAGHALCHGILAALLQRQRTGRGSTVRVSLRDVAVHLQAAPVMEYLVSGHPPPRSGNSAPMTAPADLFRCKDGELVISAYLEEHWRLLTEVLDAGDVRDDPRFATKADRVRHREALTEALEAKLGQRTAAEWLEALQAVGVVAGQVKGLAQVVDEDLERGGVVEPVDGSGHAVRNPVRVGPGPRPRAQRPVEVSIDDVLEP